MASPSPHRERGTRARRLARQLPKREGCSSLPAVVVGLLEPGVDLGVHVILREQGDAAVDAAAAEVGRGGQPIRWCDAWQNQPQVNARFGGGLDERELFGAGKRDVALAC